jgi:CBS domain-containing protein
MRDHISSLLGENPVTVNIDDSVEAVERLMVSHRLSCVPVVNSEGNCFGVISAPDFMQFHQDRENPMAEHAWEMCTHKIIEVNPDISIKKAARLMLDNNIHHLVVTEDNSVKGIISSLDIIHGCLTFTDE